MARTAVLAIRIISDATKAAKGFQQTETSASKFERRLGSVTKVVNRAGLAVGALGVYARRQASDLQQSSGAVEAVYGRQAKAIKRAGKQAADTLGLARSQYEQMSAVLGSQLKNLGTATDQLVPTNQKLIKLGGDLAATYGGTTAQAVEALSSLLRGERDPIEQYGVSIKQADINARLAAQGQSKLTGAAKRQAETEATLALLFKQTAAAQGQRARESNTDAQQAERAQAKLKNAAAAYGNVILPLTTKIASGLASVAGFAERNRTTVTAFLAVLAGGAATVYAINAAYRAYQATAAAVRLVTIAWKNAQLALNIAMMTNPIGVVIVALVAVGALMVLAYKKSDRFRAIVQAAGRAGQAALGWIVDKAKAVGTWIGKLGPAASKAKTVAVTAFKAYLAPIRLVADAVQKLIGWIKKIHFPKPPGWLKKAGGAVGGLLGSATQFRGATSAYAPRVFAAPGELKASSPSLVTGRLGGGTLGGNVYIQVDGALDPVAVANQIAGLLGRRNLRLGVSA